MSTHDSFTTGQGEYCIVDGCTIDADGRHHLDIESETFVADVKAHEVHTLAAEAAMAEARADALERSAPVKAPRKRATRKTAGASAPTPAAGAPAPPRPRAEPADVAEEFTPAVLVGDVADVGVDPGTASDIVDVIRAAMRERPRDPGGNIGPSMLGGCERKIGYQLAFGSSGERDDGSWIARVGTAVHAELDDMFRGRVEADGSRRWYTSTRITKPVRGTIDVYDSARREVIDFKVVGATTMTKARRGEIDHKYDVQLDVYGVGMIAAGYHVERVAVLFLPKTQGLDKAVWYSRPLDVGRAVTAIERLRRVETVIGVGRPFGDQGLRDALAGLTPSEDFCSSCDAKVKGYCPGVVAIPAPTGWAAYDTALDGLRGAA